MTDHDPYGGLPSLERLEGEVRELAIRSHTSWVGRNWRRLTAVGAVLAIGVAVSPAGPAFGGPDDGEISTPAAALCEPLGGASERDGAGHPNPHGFSACLIPACPPLERMVESRPRIAAIAESGGAAAAIKAAGCEPSPTSPPAPGTAPGTGATGADGPHGARAHAPLAEPVGCVIAPDLERTPLGERLEVSCSPALAPKDPRSG